MVNNLDIEKLHHVQYEILLEFDRVCKKYNLRYFLAFGTLLGAIRHDGFIPWDDDIDTMMPYDDYLKLNEIPSDEWNSPYFFQSTATDPNYRKCFAKLRNSNTTLITDSMDHLDINQGVDIDIYPIINLADNGISRRRQYAQTMLYMLLEEDIPPRNHGKVMYFGGRIILSLLPNDLKVRLKNMLLRKITEYQKNHSNESYVVCGNVEIMREVLKSSWFDGCIMHRFENEEFPIPLGYHEWLSTRYGQNYMEVPPIEKQGIKLSQFKVVDLDTPYIHYRGSEYFTNINNKTIVRNNKWHNYD